MTIYETLESTGIPVTYGRVSENMTLPYMVVMGTGQNTKSADNTFYYKKNSYRIEYYFDKKSEQNENAIEKILLDRGYQYEKSEDLYIEDEDVFAIYYYI